MTPDQIAALAAAGESEAVEFERSTGERREAARTLCAMLNHRGGRVLFGIGPDGRVVGQQVADHTIEQVAQELREIDPPAFPTIDRVPWKTAARFWSSRSRPAGTVPTATTGKPTGASATRARPCRAMSTTGRCWNACMASGVGKTSPWRVGPWTTSIRQRSWNGKESIRRARSEDPDTRDPLELLRGLGLLHHGQVLRAAMVLFGRAERLEAEVPQGVLRVAKFRGTDRTEFLDNRQFHGHASIYSARPNATCADLPIAGQIAPGVRAIDDPLYPPTALREALANANCHRDYSIGGGSVAVGLYDDRLEVTVIGHAPLRPDCGGSVPTTRVVALESDDRSHVLSPRNHRELGPRHVKIAELAASAGLPRPEIEDAGGCVTVRFRPSRYVPPRRVGHDLTERQRVILALLDASRGGLALRDILVRLADGTGGRQVREDLAALRTFGLAIASGHGRGALWKRL